MRGVEPHRKLVKHYDEPGHFHELTFSCYQRVPLLTNDTWREMLSRAIDRALVRHKYCLAAFVYVPEHVHLLVWPQDGASEVEHLLKAVKRPYSYRIKQLLIAGHSPLLKRLTGRQPPGVMTFRYWQEGPGYDRNLTERESILASIDYIHMNPVRRGLCPRAIDWRWSSARFYLNDGKQEDDALPTIHGLPFEVLNGNGSLGV
ncbi:MAG TPA: transposase [Thermoguttaceae bacterium]|nr:transposase [Thermoguttaceae bacterium]